MKKTLASLCVYASLAAAGCERETAPQTPSAPTPAPAPSPVAPTALSRTELVAALALAASAHAAGASDAAAPALAGRPFSLRLPFGCFGPVGAGASPTAVALAGDGLASWRWSEDRRSQILSLRPVDWTRSSLLGVSGDPMWDRADGYWIARPWLASDDCPAASPSTTSSPTVESGNQGASPPIEAQIGAPNAAASPFTAGLAAIQTAEGSRLGRRAGEPYSFTVRGIDKTPPAAPTAGYRLVLEGRIGTFPDGKAVRCSATNPNRRPTCIVAVALDSIRFETAAGARLSEWRPT
ncbi:hypothetical protein ACIQC9_12835 [Brevundimonas sp. NPDC092305]|uniref:hypothetical protein n=1 Tax=Brevundimonas sp. NPDC092305 TaxID=3363957 RepID=UPI0038173E14